MGKREPITAEQQLEKPADSRAIAKKQEPKEGSWGEETGNVSKRPPALISLPFLTPSSPHLFLCLLQTGRQPALSHRDHTPHCCHGERGKEKQSDCSWI